MKTIRKKINQIKTYAGKTGSLVLSVILVCAILPIQADAGYIIQGVCQVQTDAGGAGAVKTLDYGYEDNTYFSLRDIAMLLQNTDKAFSLEVTKSEVRLQPGSGYTPVGVENDTWEEGEDGEDSEKTDISLRRNELKINEETAFYYTLIMQLPSGDYDCFMMAADLAMILDVNITVPAADFVEIHTQEPFGVSPAALEEAGYFYGVNGVLVGDATTGEIYYEYQADIPYPIASTSKLMTCLLAMDAISAGQLALDEPVTISEAAQELGLSQTTFFNCNGLPVYTEDVVPAKRQNSMSAGDMYRLASYLLQVYPQITDITSMKEAKLESLDLEVKNTNPLLHNLPEVTGLKTGTTNRAGACLVTSLTADDGTMEHDLVVVVLGTEDSIERGRVSGLLARYALYVFETGTEETASEAAAQPPGNLPTNAEAAVERILRTARKR